MALTVTSRGTGTHGTGATTLVPGGRSATLAVNSLGVLCIALDNAGSAGAATCAPASWTDAKGNVWTERLAVLYDNGAASAGIEMAIYTAPITVALFTTDAGTMTWDGAVSPASKAWTWYEVIPSNGITPAFLDVGSIAGATAANATVVTASINVGDAVIAGYFSENVAAVTGDSDTTNGTWTAEQTATIGSTTSGVRIATQQKVQTTAASTQSYDATVTSQDRIAGYISVREVRAIAALPSAAGLTLSGAVPSVAAGANTIATPTAASLTLAGATPTVATTANVRAEPTAAGLTLAGATPIVTAPAVSIPAAASFTLTGATPAVAAAQTFAPSAASFVLAGAVPSVIALAPQVSVPGAASMTLAGGTPAVVAIGTASVQPAGASLALSGATPAVTAIGTALRIPGSASLTLTGAIPDVAVTTGSSVVAQPSAASLALTGAVPVVAAIAGVSPRPTAASLTLTGAVPAVTAFAPVAAVPAAATMALTGAVPAVRTPIAVQPTAAALYLAFGTPVVTASDHIVVVPGPLGLTLTGAIPAVIIPALVLGLAAQMRIAALSGARIAAFSDVPVILAGRRVP